MQKRGRFLTLAPFAGLVLLLSACAPPSSPLAGGAAPVESGPAAVPKVLTIAFLREPATFEGFTGQGGSADGAGVVRYFLHDHLTIQDDRWVVRPQLALEVPSVEKGTWRVNPDGTMDMTWKLQQGVKWHDGTPFTSADLLFSFTLHKDPDLPHAYGVERRNMESATAPDPQTFIVHWSGILVSADQARGLTPMPKHLLEDLYQTNKAAFISSPRFTTEFIGLGPYRLVKWEQGSFIEMARFDGYYQGRPPLDGMTVQFVRDSNVMVANALAGAIDLIPPPGVATDAALQLKQRWEGTGDTVRIEPVSRVVYGELQFRPEFARPVNGIPNRTVREALYRAINRAGLAEVMSHGLAPIADSWYAPTDPLRPAVESAIPQYPYDPAGAQDLLAQAGWTRGPDGVLVHQPSGERFEVEVWSIPQTDARSATLVAGDWKAIGADARPNPVPPARSEDREYQSTFPTIEMTGTSVDTMAERFNGRDVASTANRWSGRNRAAYQNPRADELLAQLTATVDPREQIPLRREHIQQLMGDVALMPVYWEVQAVVMGKAVKGDISATNPGWNVFQWDKS